MQSPAPARDITQGERIEGKKVMRRAAGMRRSGGREMEERRDQVKEHIYLDGDHFSLWIY